MKFSVVFEDEFFNTHSPQRAAFFAGAPVFASSAAVNPFLARVTASGWRVGPDDRMDRSPMERSGR
jgi:hypothetical protein